MSYSSPALPDLGQTWPHGHSPQTKSLHIPVSSLEAFLWRLVERKKLFPRGCVLRSGCSSLGLMRLVSSGCCNLAPGSFRTTTIEDSSGEKLTKRVNKNTESTQHRESNQTHEQKSSLLTMRTIYFFYCFFKSYFSENYKASGHVRTKMRLAGENCPS